MYKDPAVRLLPEVTSTSSRLVKLKLDERFALDATIDSHQGQELAGGRPIGSPVNLLGIGPCRQLDRARSVDMLERLKTSA